MLCKRTVAFHSVQFCRSTRFSALNEVKHPYFLQFGGPNGANHLRVVHDIVNI